MIQIAPARSLPHVYLRSERLLRRVLGAVKGLFDGLWLGVLPPSQLAALDELVYARREKYGDDQYNRSGLWTWEQRAVDGYFPVTGRVVVTGAGGGREVLALLALGYDAVGFECNAGLAHSGQQLLAREGHPGRISVSPRHHWPHNAGRCDAVVVGWGSYTHIAGRRQRVKFLRDARAHMPGGGVILLSFWTIATPTVYLRTVATVGSAVRALTRQPVLECGDALAGTYVHFFTRAAVEEELAEAGFTLHDYHDGEYGVAVGSAQPALPDGTRSGRHSDDQINGRPAGQGTRGRGGVA